MNLTASNNTLCYSINSPPFNFNRTITSVKYSAIFSALGLSSNLIAFIVLLKSFRQTYSRNRPFFLVFLGSLVITDFMGLLVTGSIVVTFHATQFNWRKVDPDCHLCNFMGMSMVFYGLCPLLLGAVMATERFIGINCPFTLSASMPKVRSVAMVLTVWFSAGCIAMLPLTGIGSYHLQMPGSWCFFNISHKGKDLAFSLIFSLVGLTCVFVSFLLNTVSVVTLIKVCCGNQKHQRRRDHEVEMMVQLILIMAIASVCWCPLLVFTAETVLSRSRLQIKYLLLYLRFATWNQILDPWVYILFRRAVLQRFFPRFDWSRESIMSRSSFSDTARRFTRSSILSTDADKPGENGKANASPASTLKAAPDCP